jgi:hypothetical protein
MRISLENRSRAAAVPLRRLAIALPLLAGALMLGACGSDANMTDRAGGGAAVGAGTGAAIGAIFGGVGALPGALIGAAVGGGTGVATTDEQVDLGEPVWRKDW